MGVKYLTILIFCLTVAIFASSGICPDNAGQTFQEAIFQEYGTGDLSKAIELYEEVLQAGYGNEELAAKALLRLALCYEKVGRDSDAKKAYQQIISRFPDQQATRDKATERLEKLSSGLVGDGYWFRYKGEHIYLIGAGTASIYAGSGLRSGSAVTDDPVRDWKAYIDLLVQHGINFVRFHPWDFLYHSEVPDYACPWVITSDKPAYALKSFNRRYWAKLKEIMSYASVKDIFFEIVLFDDDSPWDRHPFNSRCGGPLKDRTDYHDLGNSDNRKHQESYVLKTIDETADYPVVIYEICDAIGWQGKPLSQDTRNWVSYWVRFIKENLPVSSNHLITVSQHSWSSGGELDALWDLPGIDIISVQESGGARFALGEEYTHDYFLKYWQSGYGKPIMMNETGFGDMMRHPDGGTRGWVEERQHLWVAFASGGHAARSDFQPFAATYPSLDSCLHLANFVCQVRFWEMSPLVKSVLECDGTCYGMCSEDEVVVYVRSRKPKKDAKIKLALSKGDHEVRWYDPVQGDFLPEITAVSVEHAASLLGGEIALGLPETATDIVLYVRKVGER